jgi:hypothetical protein
MTKGAMARIDEFREEVIETLCELAGYSEDDAKTIAEEKLSDIEYGHKYRHSTTTFRALFCVMSLSTSIASLIENSCLVYKS